MDAPTTQPRQLDQAEQEKTEKGFEVHDPLQEALVRLAEINELFNTEKIHENSDYVENAAQRSMYSSFCKKLLEKNRRLGQLDMR